MAIVYDGTKRSLGRRLIAMFDVADQNVDDRMTELLGRLMAVSTSADQRSDPSGRSCFD